MSIPVTGSWTLTFDEEFNGTALNKDVWGDNWLGADGAITKPINSEELGAYDPAQVSVSGGVLHLNAIESPVAVNGINYRYRSGIVQSHDSFSQTYGYFEAKIFLQGKDGRISNWPAFWTAGENWPEDGEMDVMEGLGGEAAYHFHSPSGGPGESVDGDFTGWHVFAALWEPGKVSYYYDNRFVGEIATGITDSPMYLILNLGIGVHSLISVPAEMQVDWVHVYSNDPSAVAVTPQPGYEGPGGIEQIPEVFGTAADDMLTGSALAERIVGRDGNDTVSGLGGDDVLSGGDGADFLQGGAGDDWINGGAGVDAMNGGNGDDVYHVDHGGDIVDETGAAGIDRVGAEVSFNLANATRVRGDVEKLVLRGTDDLDGYGNALDNVLIGNAGNNVLYGATGDDVLSGGDGSDRFAGAAGDDRVLGGAGADTLTGGAGADRLRGGLGGDTFVFAAVGSSVPGAGGFDCIGDFNRGERDRISLSAIDADTTTAGNQAFSFIGTAVFSGQSGELRYEVRGSALFVHGDVDGDGNADLAIKLADIAAISSGDFFL
jgi:Ca2+-binding RTX toxin-like protein